MEGSAGRPAIPPEVQELLEDVIEFEVAAAYERGRMDESARRDAELGSTLAHVFGGERCESLQEAVDVHLRELGRRDARRAAQSPAAAAPEVVEWDDAVTRVPGESPDHYDWRCRRAARERAAQPDAAADEDGLDLAM